MTSGSRLHAVPRSGPGTGAADVVAAVDTALSIARFSAAGGAWAALDERRARREAQAGARPVGALERDVIGVKDVIAVEGLVRAAGSAAGGARPSIADSVVVACLRRQGAIVLGTTAMHELAFGVTGVNERCGTPRNPAAPGCIPGGSSSGSAVAVAERSCTIALGTDTGGSVRIPAALCGVVGFKPNKDAYPTAGVLPLSPTLDHVGVLARRVRDVDRVHRALGGRAAAGAPQVVGIAEEQVEAASPTIAAAIEAALESLRRVGVETRRVELPSTQEVLDVSTTIMFTEAAAVHAHRAAAVGPGVAERLRAGREIDAGVYLTARRTQARLRRQLAEALEEIDVVIGPTTPVGAPPLAQAADPGLAGVLVANTRLANLCGTPAISLPLPDVVAGLQIQGLGDGVVLSAAYLVERAIAGEVDR